MLYISSNQTSLTANGVVHAGQCALVSLCICGGADAATVTIYDNASAASGTVLCKLGTAAGTSATFCPAHPVTAGAGLYAAVTGTTPQVNAAFLP